MNYICFVLEITTRSPYWKNPCWIPHRIPNRILCRTLYENPYRFPWEFGTGNPCRFVHRYPQRNLCRNLRDGLHDYIGSHMVSFTGYYMVSYMGSYMASYMVFTCIPTWCRIWHATWVFIRVPTWCSAWHAVWNVGWSMNFFLCGFINCSKFPFRNLHGVLHGWEIRHFSLDSEFIH